MRLQTRLSAECDPFFSAADGGSEPQTLERIWGADLGNGSAGAWRLVSPSSVVHRLWRRR